MAEWIQSHAGSLVVASALLAGVSLLISAVAVPLLILELPPDALRKPRPSHHVGLRGLRNLAGSLLLLVGAVLLFLPGQGLLTLATGALLVDFPGRRALLRRLGGSRRVLSALNRIRRHFGRPPLLPARESRPES
ncbi:MAG: hypothetical protein MJE66_18220 [Proteobacteria bacterium]|nr:hypothetical protein [Pseudomonadota bacterium]